MSEHRVRSSGAVAGLSAVEGVVVDLLLHELGVDVFAVVGGSGDECMQCELVGVTSPARLESKIWRAASSEMSAASTSARRACAACRVLSFAVRSANWALGLGGQHVSRGDLGVALGELDDELIHERTALARRHRVFQLRHRGRTHWISDRACHSEIRDLT
jgi:hypothetical protein